MRNVMTRAALLPSLLGGLVLAGCAQAPVNTTVTALPGPGKSDADFQADVSACKTTASQAIAGQAQSANATAVTGALAGALTGGSTADVASGGMQATQAAQANLQTAYDTAFKDCIVAHNDLLPGMTPPPAVAEAAPEPVSDPLIRHVQQQLVRLGYLHGGADGVAGPKTAGAITSYEQDHHLTVDGTASHSLLASLKADAGNGGAAPATKAAGWDVPPPPPAQ
jgi:hypothetical protein